MKIVIKKPTIAYLEDCTQSELDSVKKQTMYKSGKVDQLIKRHKLNRWWKKKNRDSWDERLEYLQSQVDCSILEKDSNGYFIRSGLIPYLRNLTFTVVNEVEVPELKPIKWKVEPEFTPYQYQSDSVKGLLEYNHGNIDLPTGCGKSFILLMLAQRIGKDVVVITPSKSIFRELYEEFQLRLGKDKVGGYGDGKKDIKKPITIAIGKSLTMLKEDSPEFEFFKNKKALLVDESHTWGSETLQDICHGVLQHAPRRFFVSATQTRNDGTLVILRSIIGKNVYSMDLKDAISKGFLCPLKFNVLNTISPSTKTKLDPLECKREHFLYNKNIIKLCAKLANAKWRIEKESTLILVEELYQIKAIIDLLEVPYTYIHSASKKESESAGLNKVDLTVELERFNKGEVRVLIGTKSIATGTNIYPTHNTINFSGGSSEITTKQGTMGRSTRWMKARYAKYHKEKKFSQIWDFNVSGQVILENMLISRIRYYKETGEDVFFLG